MLWIEIGSEVVEWFFGSFFGFWLLTFALHLIFDPSSFVDSLIRENHFPEALPAVIHPIA